MTHSELVEKLKQAQDLLSDVYHWACDENEHIESLMSCADSCTCEAMGVLDDLIRRKV